MQYELNQMTSADTALRKSQRTFQRLFDERPDATVLVDHTGRIFRANTQTAKLFGARADELAGQSVERLLLPRFRAELAARLADCFRARSESAISAGFEVIASRPSGCEFPVELRLGLLEAEEDSVATVTSREIAEHLRLADNLDVRARFFEFSPSADEVGDFR